MMRKAATFAAVLLLATPAFAQGGLLVKAGRNALQAKSGIELLAGSLEGTARLGGAEAVAKLVRDDPQLLQNADVLELLDAARTGDLYYSHEIFQRHPALMRLLQDPTFTNKFLATDVSKLTASECGLTGACAVEGIGKTIEEAANVAARSVRLVPPGPVPAYLAARPIGGVYGQKRVVVEDVWPEIDSGRTAIKRIVGEPVHVEADLVVDGHDVLRGVVRYRTVGEQTWSEAPLRFLENDRWGASFTPAGIGRTQYEVAAWVDDFATWQRNVIAKVEAETVKDVDWLEGHAIILAAAQNTNGAMANALRAYAGRIGSAKYSAAHRAQVAASDDLSKLMSEHATRRFVSTNYGDPHIVDVARKRAGFSAWYEFFPRSAGPAGHHGTLADAEKMLPYIKEMGFDVVYIPPVHPIGTTARKGANNARVAASGEPGSPWAIGNADGGHKAVNPLLGTIDDMERFVKTARENDLEVAMDIAYQVSPDHPYLKAHPDWFRRRPDGSIAYAENPPKEYFDIHNFNWEGEGWPEMWYELKSVVDFWAERGVRVFRVDNPHTKPIRFWAWMIQTVKVEHPDAIFLAEAFTKPKLMNALAKSGFDQSYTYFTWRTSKYEIEQYMRELTQSPAREYFRPNFWPNTPDILPANLQDAVPAMFKGRMVLAATLSSNYGVYGPAYELMDGAVLKAGTEEYLASEKFQLREWDIGNPDSLAEFIARVNGIRNANPALHDNTSLRFLNIPNDALVAYSKQQGDDIIVTVVNLDPQATQSGLLEIPLEQFGIVDGQSYQMHDLLTESRFIWSGRTGLISLNPNETPAHIFKIRKKVRSEGTFDIYE